MKPIHKILMALVADLRDPRTTVIVLGKIEYETREAMAAFIARAVAQDEKRSRRKRKRGKKVKILTATGKKLPAVIDSAIVDQAMEES